MAAEPPPPSGFPTRGLIARRSMAEAPEKPVAAAHLLQSPKPGSGCFAQDPWSPRPRPGALHGDGAVSARPVRIRAIPLMRYFHAHAAYRRIVSIWVSRTSFVFCRVGCEHRSFAARSFVERASRRPACGHRGGSLGDNQGRSGLRPAVSRKRLARLSLQRRLSFMATVGALRQCRVSARRNRGLTSISAARFGYSF